MIYFSENIKIRFFGKVIKTDGCWFWQAGMTKDGYGLFGVAPNVIKTAHRYSKEMAIGQRIPRELDASHLCENRACVNPDHLVVETKKENMARMVRVIKDKKKRIRVGIRKRYPDKRPRVAGTIQDKRRNIRKLPDEAILFIRSKPESQEALAHRFGVRLFTIQNIQHRRTYKDI